MVDLHEVLVLRQGFLGSVETVDIRCKVVVVGLMMDETLQGQTVGEGRLFCRPANGDGGYWHDELGQTEHVDNLLRLIDGGAQIAVAKSLLVEEVAKRLRVE